MNTIWVDILFLSTPLSVSCCSSWVIMHYALIWSMGSHFVSITYLFDTELNYMGSVDICEIKINVFYWFSMRSEENEWNNSEDLSGECPLDGSAQENQQIRQIAHNGCRAQVVHSFTMLNLLSLLINCYAALFWSFHSMNKLLNFDEVRWLFMSIFCT